MSSNNELLHYSLTVTGRVQGVFYRASTREKARELGIAGFVKNQPDGTVYIEAESTQEQLDQLVEWCKSGSSAASVNQVEVEQGELQGYDSFEISY